MSARFHKWVRQLHKWAGLILVLQILFWIAGGFIMSAIPLEMVHGKHLAKQSSASPWPADQPYFSLDDAKNSASFDVTSIELLTVAERPVYVLKGNGEVSYLDAMTGNPVAPLNEQHIRQLSENYYLKSHPIKTIGIIDESVHEAARAEIGSWQVIFDDWLDTTLYLHPTTGKLLHVRSDLWRVFDFVWMLHIMDYEEREDFNNPLLISFAFASLLFTITGIILLFKSFTRKNRRKALF